MPSAIFKRNLESINVELSDKQIEQLDKYYEILVEWNSFMNLTGITEYEEVMLKHYLDSLVLKLPIDGGNLNIKLIDVGTGAGFPGLPLKIAYPDTEVVLFDSLNKRMFKYWVADDDGFKIARIVIVDGKLKYRFSEKRDNDKAICVFVIGDDSVIQDFEDFEDFEDLPY